MRPTVATNVCQVPPYIYGDIGGADRWIWFVLANLLSLAAVCPPVSGSSPRTRADSLFRSVPLSAQYPTLLDAAMWRSLVQPPSFLA